VREEFGEKAEAVAFNDPGGFEAGFVVGETFFGREAGHADVNAGELRFARGVEVFDFAMARGGGVEEDDVDVVMMGGFGFGAELAKGSACESAFGFSIVAGGSGHCESQSSRDHDADKLQQAHCDQSKKWASAEEKPAHGHSGAALCNRSRIAAAWFSAPGNQT
jgi:hypothetical protein